MQSPLSGVKLPTEVRLRGGAAALVESCDSTFYRGYIVQQDEKGRPRKVSASWRFASLKSLGEERYDIVALIKEGQDVPFVA